MREEATRKPIRACQLQRLLQAWTWITHFLVHNGCSAHLLKELFIVYTSRQVDQASVDSILTRFLGTSANIARIDPLELIAIISKSLTTNQPQNSDSSTLDHDRHSETNLSVRQNGSQPTNARDQEASSPNVEGSVDGVTNDKNDEENDDSDLDDPFGVSPRLVSLCASLSQCHSKSLEQASEGTLDTEDVVYLQSPWGRQESPPMSRSSTPPNPAHSKPPITPTILAFVAGPGNSNIIPGQGCEASPLTKLPRIHIHEEQATRLGESVNQTGEPAIPPDVLLKIQRIASPEIISTLWYYLRAQRTSLLGTGTDQKATTAEPPDTAEERVRSLLSRYQTQYEAAPNDIYFPEFPRRLYLANIYSLYNQETITRKQNPRQRKRKRRTATSDHKAGHKSLNDIFIDFLLPQLQKEDSTRQNAKKRFENWMALGRICAKLVGHFGEAILLLPPPDLWNETLRALTIRQEDALITYLHQFSPGLASDIQNLTTFLLQVVEEQRPPIMKMTLEGLSEHEIGSGEHARRSLKELFEYSDEVDYTLFLTEGTHSPPSTAASPRSLPELEPASGDSTTLPDAQIFDQSITYDAEYLADGKAADDLWEDYFS
ncbi:hypothetical protein BGZ60DRAFT_73790 [Tricladium varicosporioides]|nr:hypothetical protein BGZ60DRAFT_73790 [Hymenoscyphus varicosporioides]